MGLDYAMEFADLGADIDCRWRKQAFDEDAFPTIAVEAAAKVADLDLDSLLFQQYDRLDLSYRFSDFDLRIFYNDRFRIDILYWLGSHTSIHQHAFSGAFKLLSGRSLHAEYDFSIRREVHPELLIGDLHLCNSEILEPGSIRRIETGARFIHANFHIVRPTVTMVIRTQSRTDPTPQFAYHHPYIAKEPFLGKDLRTRQERLIEFVSRTGQCNLVEHAVDTVWPDPTLIETFDILHLPVVMRDPVRLDRALARAADRHPTFATEVAATIREDLRREKGMILFRQPLSADQRFVVALLINLQSVEMILRHLAAEFPGEAPEAAAARLVAAMSAAGYLAPVPEGEVATLAEVIEGRRLPEDAPRLRGLLAEDVLRPLFSRAHRDLTTPGIGVP
jgi:hypothetical protein